MSQSVFDRLTQPKPKSKKKGKSDKKKLREEIVKAAAVMKAASASVNRRALGPSMIADARLKHNEAFYRRLRAMGGR